MSLMTISAPASRNAPPRFVRMAKPRAAGGVGDIADAVMGLATTALSIAAAERQAYLAKKQAEAVAKAQQAANAAAAQAAQQQLEQQRLAQAAQQEALRNSMVPAGLGLGAQASGSFTIPSWAPWAALGAVAVGVGARMLSRRR